MRLSDINEARVRVVVEYDPRNSQATQRPNAGPSYQRAADWIARNLPDVTDVLDYGAGLLHGTEILSKTLNKKVHSHEPFPDEGKGVIPTHIKPPTGQAMYDVIVCLNLLNVLHPAERAEVVTRIKRLLRRDGVAIIGVRKWKEGVDKTKVKWDENVMEPHSLYTKSKGRTTYQKGFETAELVDYLQDIFGDNFEIMNAGNRYGDISVIVRRF